MGCGCLFALFATFTPRLGVVFLWLFTPMVNRAFDGFILPLVGTIFLPFTTLIYLFAWTPVGLTTWGWIWVGLGVLVDISSYAGSAYSNRDKIPGYTSSNG